MADDQTDESLDEIDRILLRILSKEPRMSYNSIANKLLEEGYEMSAEGVRHRVRKLLDATSTFFLFAPGQHDWEIVRVGLRVKAGPRAKETVMEFLTESGFWLVCDGLGTIDIYAVATAISIEDLEKLVTSVRGHELVTDVDFSIETERITDIENYFSHGVARIVDH